MNNKNIEDFQQWYLLSDKDQKDIMDRLRNPKLSMNHLGCQNCDTLSDTLTQYKEALRELVEGVYEIENKIQESDNEDLKLEIYSLAEDLAIFKQLLNNE